MLRVVLDANVVVSGFIRPTGTCGLVLTRVIRGDGIRAVLSPAILDEYRRSLAYPKVARYLGATEDQVAVWLDALTLLADVVPGERVVRVVEADPDDDKYFAAALEGRAAVVVTGDRQMQRVGTYEGVLAVSPRAFLDAHDG